jgi:hypothetical protein
MTKAELFALIVNVPEDSQVFVMGVDIQVVAYSLDSRAVSLDDSPAAFEGAEDEFVFLWRAS